MKRFSLDVFGLTLVAIGLLLFPLPVPVGLLLIALGALVLAISEPWMQRLIKTQRLARPGFESTIRALYKRLPKSLQHIIEVTDPHK
ncbi:MAG: PGPGW domain-containing protein [Patescibacteria group bacterium UBA2163]